MTYIVLKAPLNSNQPTILVKDAWLLNKKAAGVEVNISPTFLHWVRIAFHP